MLKFQLLTDIIKDSGIMPSGINGLDFDVWVDNFILEAVKREIAHMSQTPCDFCNRDNDNCMECWLEE